MIVESEMCKKLVISKKVGKTYPVVDLADQMLNLIVLQRFEYKEGRKIQEVL